MKKNMLKLAAATIIAVSAIAPSAGVFADEDAVTTSGEINAEDTTIEDTTADDVSTEDITIEDATADDVSTEDITIEDTTDDVSTEDTTIEDTTIEDTTIEDTTEETSVDFENSVVIDGKKLESAEVIVSENVPMFPARKVFEALGYTVEWQAETKTVIVSDLPQYITFSVGTDGYTIAKTAPMKLNKAPELIDEVTYVPVTLLTELMEMNVKVDEAEPYNIYVTTLEEIEETTENTTSEVVSGEETTENTGDEVSDKDNGEENVSIEKNAKVISIEPDSILVNDAEKGEVALAVGDDTVIAFDDGTEGSLDDIKENVELYVEYGDEMTMSIPPVNNPVKVVIFK